MTEQVQMAFVFALMFVAFVAVMVNCPPERTRN